jgi:hypothetical protein
VALLPPTSPTPRLVWCLKRHRLYVGYVDGQRYDGKRHQVAWRSNALTQLWGFTPFDIAAGTYILTDPKVSFGSKATVAGNFNFGAVPEPATWSMLLGGFVMIGGAMRRRRVQRKVQLRLSKLRFTGG